MIDKNDSKTVDAFPVKKRGRPSTGKAMSAAERKRAQRKRALFEVRKAASGEIKFSDVSMTALITELQAAVLHGYSDTVKLINAELLKRAKSNRDSHKK